mmetsp:Transcript_77455/g.134347  ORF Transcript_77455/g.134347 Transcript_77455/m.134347 type:complete len:150 (+) Transcript_77455:480-929(+)
MAGGERTRMPAAASSGNAHAAGGERRRMPVAASSGNAHAAGGERTRTPEADEDVLSMPRICSPGMLVQELVALAIGVEVPRRSTAGILRPEPEYTGAPAVAVLASRTPLASKTRAEVRGGASGRGEDHDLPLLSRLRAIGERGAGDGES